jgi:hypothetical protein
MNSIIFICNEPHIAIVKTVIQPLIQGKVTIIPDFESGMAAIFEKRPVAVFIQHEIDRVGAGTLTGQIRALLQRDAPRFFLLGTPFARDEENASFDGSVSLSLPEELLVDECLELMRTVPALRWKNPELMTLEALPLLPEAETTGEPDTIDRSGLITFEEPEASPVVQVRASIPPADTSTIEAPPDVSTDMIEYTLPYSPPISLKVVTVGLRSRDADSTAPWPSGEEHAAPGHVVRRSPSRNRMTSVIMPSRPGRHSRRLYGLAAVALVALLCGAGASLLVTGESPELPATANLLHALSSAAHVVSSQPPPLSRHVKLPSFIPVAGRDKTYRNSNPGWERYASPAREFLIYRENSGIKAIQVVALKKGGIDDAFISSVLRELCGVNTCDVMNRSEQNGYIVEQGQTKSKAEVMIYRKKEAGDIRGAVFSLP